MEMTPIEDIEGMMSFEDAKKELARISGLLANTTDDVVFIMRLASIRSLVTLLERYCTLDQVQKAEHPQF